MSEVGSTPGGAMRPDVSAAASNPAMVLSIGTPIGEAWLPSGGARAQPSVPRPLGASTWRRSLNVYMGTATDQSSGVRPSGVVQGAKAPFARPRQGSGQGAATGVAPHITCPASSAALAVGAPP